LSFAWSETPLPHASRDQSGLAGVDAAPPELARGLLSELASREADIRGIKALYSGSAREVVQWRLRSAPQQPQSEKALR
jgi:hypothetical protein